MVIGHLMQTSNGKTGEELREWMQLIVQPVGMSRISCTFHPNRKENKKENEPDFILYESIQRRGDIEKYGKPFKTRAIGAGWKRVSSDKKTEFISCQIETPLVYGGKLQFSLFQTKVREDENPEDIFWLYDAVWNPYSKNTNNSYTQNNDYAAPATYTQNNAGDKIPVNIQNQQGKPVSVDDLFEYGM